MLDYLCRLTTVPTGTNDDNCLFDQLEAPMLNCGLTSGLMHHIGQHSAGKVDVFWFEVGMN